jgi:hypothetical protein
VNELETARETYEAFKRTDAFVNWRCADALIAALTARVEELEREQSAPWHVGAFIEVDGLTVGPHMVRDWRERLEQAEAALLNQQALATANVELAKRAEQAEAEVALLKATMHKVIPFIGWGAYVPDLVQEAEDVSGYGGRDE